MSLVYQSPVDALPLRRLADEARHFLTRRVLIGVSLAAFALVVLASVVTGLIRPEHNWDMAPYIAVSFEDRISDPEALHKAAWDATLEGVGDGQRYELTRGNPYNIDQFANPDHFFSQLTMYRVKVAYTETIRLLDHWVSPVMATAIIASVSTLFVGLALSYWAVRRDFAQGLLFATPTIVLAGYFDMALLATPDMMMAAFAIPGMYLASRGKAWSAVPFLLAMYLVRPDGIIFLFAMLLSALAFGRDRLPYLLTFAAAIVLYGPITAAANHPGWWPHFYFSIIELQNDMRGFSPAFDPLIYLKGIIRGISVALRYNNWPMIMGVLLLAWAYLAVKGRVGTRPQVMVMTAIILNFMGKFVTFPLPDDRVYFIFVVPFLMLVLEIWKPDFSLAGRRGSGERGVAKAEPRAA